ncbi:craniofacial development protein 2-like [Schistocerca piceifrons]|uniref:craniofacial development protein 2-like n=1 Tax=Schistocerca piceifrons TaxID=274613 RepID=UPI001F5F472E|nr:craniofacial development protein 2-like [Schistocerca piceifrons]
MTWGVSADIMRLWHKMGVKRDYKNSAREFSQPLSPQFSNFLPTHGAPVKPSNSAEVWVTNPSGKLSRKPHGFAQLKMFRSFKFPDRISGGTRLRGASRRVRWCKEKHCIGTWNVRSMYQGKLDIVKREMEKINIDILGISEMRWTGMGEFALDGHMVYYSGHDNNRSNGVAFIVSDKVRKAVMGCKYKNDRMMSIRLQGQPLNITVIQVYAPTTDAEKEIIDEFYGDLQELLLSTPKKNIVFIDGAWNAKRWKSAVHSATTRPGADCGSDYELLIAKFWLKLQTVAKSIPTCRYNLNSIPSDYTVEVQNRFNVLELEDKSSQEMWTEVANTVKEAAEKHIPKKRNSKKARWLSVEALQVAEEQRKAKIKGDRSVMFKLNKDFQKLARRDKNIFFNKQCKEVEDSYGMGKTRVLYKKIREIKGKFQAKIGMIKDRNGKDLSEAEDVKERWA